MPRSLTISQINALGERLRRAPKPSGGDLALLQQLRADHDEALTLVADRIRARGLSLTQRVKTEGTILDKLKRERTRLSRMQDIAGVRIVTEPGLGLVKQDEVVATVESLFPDAIVVDRRKEPNHGYRAVHVVAVVDECAVEIQIRTRLQHGWANWMEKLADFLGRQIRYGLPPNEPDAPLGKGTQRDWVLGMLKYSELLADFEESMAVRDVDRADQLLDEIATLLEGLLG